MPDLKKLKPVSDFYKNKKQDVLLSKKEIELNRLLKEQDKFNKDKEAIKQKGYIDNPQSITYKKQKQIIDRKKTFVSQDNRTKEEEEIDKAKGEFNIAKKDALKRADVVTDFMQLGNFIPHPLFQSIGKAGNTLGSMVDGYQAYKDYENGDYASATINGTSALLPKYLDTKAFGRNTKYSPIAKDLNKVFGDYGRSTYLNTLNQVKKQSKSQLNINRALLGTLGAETIYDSQNAMGGNINNMKKYAEGGTLNQFNEGGLHEQNPNGGIPQGPNATVEQGETSTKTPSGKYIYSNRLYINEDLVKQFNLPNSIKGKTFADASKVIDKPFKDKNSNPDKLTHKEHLDRLKQAQETLKAEEQQKQQAMMQNMQQMPDVSENPVPEGMEEFTEPQNNPQEEIMEQPQASAYGGFLKGYGLGGDLLTAGLSTGANMLLPGSGALVQPLMQLGQNIFKKNDNSILNNNAITANSQFSDTFAKGGYLEGTLTNENITKNLSSQFLESKLPNITDIEGNASIPKPIIQNNNKSFLNKTTDYLDKNGGKMLKYAPVAMNAYQLSQLKKPQGVVLDRLGNRFKPTYMDEASMQNNVSNEMNNTVAGLTNATAGSEGALRANLVGAGVGRIRGMNDAYAKMREFNAGQSATGQQFNLGVDQANIGQSNMQLDINDKNAAAYRNEKSKYLGAIGTDLGEIGKEEIFKNQAAKITGYSWMGDFLNSNPNYKAQFDAILKDPTLNDNMKYAKQKALADKIYKGFSPEQRKFTQDSIKETSTYGLPQAYGGYLKINKIGRK